jgi:pimeloyl-[acyl-carrier protein] methyl ester esterase
MNSIHLVLLPGLDGTGLLFQPLLDVLPTNIKPITVSYPPDKILGYDELLPIVLEHLPKTESFVLLGESFSGPLALKVAATKPNTLKGLVLCASFVRCPYPFVPRYITALIYPFMFQWLKGLAKINAYKGSKLAIDMLNAISQVQNQVLAHRVQEIIQVDVSQELAGCRLPILYLQGAKDFVVPKGNLRRILKTKPDVRCSRIDSSHMLLQTRPLQAVEAIRDFIKNLEQ